jgi:hypothetical protein
VLAHLEDEDTRHAGRALVSALLAVAIVLGSLVLWIGIPLLGFWLAGELTTTGTGFLFATLGGIPPAMVAFGWLLYRINALYVRSHGPAGLPQRQRSAWLVSLSDERGRERRERAPRPLIEVAMWLSAWAAVLVLAIWFFFFSKMWLVNPL